MLTSIWNAGAVQSHNQELKEQTVLGLEIQVAQKECFETNIAILYTTYIVMSILGLVTHQPLH